MRQLQVEWIMRMFLISLVSLMITVSLQGQSLHEDPAVTQLMDDFVEYNKTHTEVRGWRIQVLSTTDRRTMESTETKFRRIFPEYQLHFEHQSPFYNLKTGAFLSQQDARPMLRLLQKDFPGAYLVTDKFEIAEVLDYQM